MTASDIAERIKVWRALLQPVGDDGPTLGLSRQTWTDLAAGVLFALTGAALVSLCLGFGFARDNSMMDFFRGEANRGTRQAEPSPARTVPLAQAPTRGLHRHIVAANVTPRVPSRRAVCVRACDGYFFPLGKLEVAGNWAGEEAMCAGMCPGAATHVYYLPLGTEDMHQAVSAAGGPYSALPAAFRHTQTADSTCSCEEPNQGQFVALMKDLTLRPGDAVTTSSGIRIFKGAAHWPYRNNDFLSLVDARSLRLGSGALQAIEKMIKQPGSWRGAPDITASATPAKLPAVAKGIPADGRSEPGS